MTLSERRPSPAIAFVVFLYSAAWISGSRAGADELGHYAAVFVGLAGALAAASIWRGASTALRYYALWAVTAFLVHTALDARVEPELWKVAAAAGASGAILFGIGMWLHAHRSNPPAEDGVPH